MQIAKGQSVYREHFFFFPSVIFFFHFTFSLSVRCVSGRELLLGDEETYFEAALQISHELILFFF